MPKHSIRQPAMFDNPQLVELPAKLYPLVAARVEWSVGGGARRKSRDLARE